MVSQRNTFGNVVLEALASGVPAVVTDKDEPEFIVENNSSGNVCRSDEEFTACVLRIINSASLRRDMTTAARLRAERASWDAVFAGVYETYRLEVLHRGEIVKPCALAASKDQARPSF